MSLVSVSRSISTEKLANEATIEGARDLLHTKKSVSFARLTLYSAMRAPMGSRSLVLIRRDIDLSLQANSASGINAKQNAGRGAGPRARARGGGRAREAEGARWN